MNTHTVELTEKQILLLMDSNRQAINKLQSQIDILEKQNDYFKKTIIRFDNKTLPVKPDTKLPTPQLIPNISKESAVIGSIYSVNFKWRDEIRAYFKTDNKPSDVKDVFEYLELKNGKITDEELKTFVKGRISITMAAMHRKKKLSRDLKAGSKSEYEYRPIDFKAMSAIGLRQQ